MEGPQSLRCPDQIKYRNGRLKGCPVTGTIDTSSIHIDCWQCKEIAGNIGMCLSFSHKDKKSICQCKITHLMII